MVKTLLFRISLTPGELFCIKSVKAVKEAADRVSRLNIRVKYLGYFSTVVKTLGT